MLKKKRGISLLITLTFLLSLLLPMGAALAAPFTKAGGVPTVPDNASVNLGSILVEVPASADA